MEKLIPMDFEAYRAEFPTLSRKTYLNTCSLGALSTRTRAGVNRYLDLWEDLGASAWYEIWMGEIEALRMKFARLIGAHKDEVGIAPNVSAVLATIASAMDYRERNQVVCNDLDFPTIPYQWLVKPGVKVSHARTPDGIHVPTEAYKPLVSEATAAVATSHVFYTSGYIQDVKAITRTAHAAGALSIIDAYQGTGQVPTDVKEIGCDVLITGGLKWLLGGTGISYFYVSREAQRKLGPPTTTGWFAHGEQFRFDNLAFSPKGDARRFELGTPSISAVYAGSAALDIVLEVGSENIRRRTTELVNDLHDRLHDAGFALKTPKRAEERAGIVMVEMPDPAGVVKRLAAENIIVDFRPGRLRLSPYFYNTIEENAKVVEAIQRAVKA
ncbi:MAG TPA: aminotransferase class V-fold PLP-dependent enzyme [Candidatus Thermoplasmatota archaeon]|nr:aminotransferase class V-fold PLP-dependent enzyme [Candidatus Thermoplasmatota archaeon]